MTVDARCLIATDLGILKDGSGLSEDHSQETGLVTYRGSFIFDGLHTPVRGRVIQLAYARPQYGTSGLLTRFYPRLHVISSSADPFANITTVEVGCALTLQSSRTDIPSYKASENPPAWWSALSPDRQAVVPPTISAQGVINYCLAALGISLASGSATTSDTFLRNEIDLSGGCVSVLSDLLRSSLLIGHMTPAGELLVRPVELSAANGPVLTRNNLLSLQSISGRDGAEQVIVEYDAVEIPKSSDDIDSVDINSEEQELRDWELEVVIGPVEQYLIVFFGLTITYGPGGIESSGPNESRGTKIHRVTQTTTTRTQYQTFGWVDVEGKPQSQDLAISRSKQITAGGNLGFDTSRFYYPSTGGIPGGGSETTIYTYVTEPEGPRLVREETNTIMSSTSFSSIVPFYGSEFGTLVREKDLDSSKVIVDYVVDKDAGLTKTVTTRYTSQVKTQSGINALYGNISNAQNSFQVQEAINASEGQTKVSVETKINYGREFGLQERPTAQARQRDALTGAFIDDNSLANSGTVASSYGQREPQTVTTSYSFGGSGATTLSTATYRLPYAPDDSITATNGTSTGIVDLNLVRGSARGRALEYGRIQNAIAFGHANGVEVTTAPWELPSAPFAPVYIDVSGLSTAFRVHGRNWEIRNGAMVVTADLMLAGTAGRLTGQTPIAWMPLTSSAGALNSLGAPSGSGELLPANTITLPSGFSPAAPGSVWTSLPTTGSDTYGPNRTPAAIAPPFVQTTRILAISRSAVVVTELLYSTVPITESIVAVSRSKAVTRWVNVTAVPLTTITLTAPVPSVFGAVTVFAPVSTITLTAVSPSVFITAPVFPPVSALTLTAPAPTIEP